MNKYLIAICMAGVTLGATLLAQDNNLDLLKQIDKSDADATKPSPSPTPQGEPTVITATKESSFDGPSKVAIFKGDVQVKSPQFTLTADTLTVYFNKDAGNTSKVPGASKSPAPKVAETPKPAASSGAPQTGGIEKVIAEGNVTIESDRPDPKGGPPTHYAGKSDKLVYTPATGEAVLSGWPQLQQGINTMVATESSTVIYLNRDQKMHSEGGPVKMVVHDPGPDKSPTPGSAPVINKTPEMK